MRGSGMIDALKQKIKGRKSKVYIYHVEAGNVWKQQGVFTDSSNIETKEGFLRKTREIFFCAVEPLRILERKKYYPSVLHYRGEPFVRDWNFRVCNDEKKRKFLIDNKLYYVLEKDDKEKLFYMKAGKEKTEVRSNDPKLITLPGDQQAIIYNVSDMEFLRNQYKAYIKSKAGEKFIQAAGKVPVRDDQLFKAMIIFSIMVVLIVFFITGGIETIKFW